MSGRLRSPGSRSSPARTTASAPPPPRRWRHRAPPSCAPTSATSASAASTTRRSRRPTGPPGWRGPTSSSSPSGRRAAGRPRWRRTCPTPPAVPQLFDAAEAQLGPVQILVNNASGWIADTFVPAATDRFGRVQSPSAQHPRPGARGRRPGGGAADRRVRASPRRPRGRMGPHHRPHLRRCGRLPRGGLLRRRQGGAGQLHAECGRRAGASRRHRQRRPPAHHRHRVDRHEDGSLAGRPAGASPRPSRWPR